MKVFIKSLAVLLLSVIVIVTAFPVTASAETQGFEPRLTSPKRSNPYYNSELNVYSQTGYGMPNCVAYAFGRVYEITGEKPLITHGSAGDWWFINKRNGYYDYGSEPKLGAVACWSNHVAVVEEIDGDTVTASQSHWGGKYFDTTVFKSGSNRFGQKFYGYIYMCDDYFAELEKEIENKKKQEIKERLTEKVEDMSCVAPAEKEAPEFSQIQLMPSDDNVMINSEMLKNALKSN